jgi:hypothetical protein
VRKVPELEVDLCEGESDDVRRNDAPECVSDHAGVKKYRKWNCSWTSQRLRKDRNGSSKFVEKRESAMK